MTLSLTAERTALAAHLRKLSARLDDLDARCADLAAAVTGEVLPQLAAHTAPVQQLVDTLAGAGGGPVDWVAMDADRAETQWEHLADWIADTLVPWHEITRDQLPDCWALHRPAVVQLAWLRDSYRAAYPGAHAHLAAEWHTRWLPAALGALRDAIPRRGAPRCVVADTIVRTVELGVASTNAGLDRDTTVVFCDLVTTGPGRCPGCESAGIYRDTVERRVTDVPVAGHPMLLRVKVPRYRCSTPPAPGEVFRHDTGRLARPGCCTTRRCATYVDHQVRA